MNIGVDAYPLSQKKVSGISRYVLNIMNNLPLVDHTNKYFLYAKSGLKDWENKGYFIRGRSSSSETCSSVENTAWLYTLGTFFMKEDGIDLFWGTRHMLPPKLPRNIKKVLTVHDLVWHYFPKTMKFYYRMLFRCLGSHFIKSADHIISVSKSTASSLTNSFNISPEKVTVIYHAADSYKLLDKQISSKKISEKYNVSRDYLLTVGTIEPRKNLKFILNVLSRLKNEGLQLVVAGAIGWRTSSIFKEYSRLGLSDKHVKFLGYVPEEDMNTLYSGASLFLFPSIYEGFGLPPLEAMASGTPVISSNISSLPEVVGDAGILLSPFDAKGWMEAILSVISDSKLRQELIDKGLKRAKSFSWLTSAAETLKVFQKFI